MLYYLGFKNKLNLKLKHCTETEMRIKINFNHTINNQSIFLLQNKYDNTINPYNPSYTHTLSILTIKLSNPSCQWQDLLFITNNIYIKLINRNFFLNSLLYDYSLLYWNEDMSNYNIYINYKFDFIDKNVVKIANNKKRLMIRYKKKNNFMYCKALYDTVNDRIPKIIYQTWKNKNIVDSNIIQNIKKINKEFNYEFYDDAMCEKWMKNNFDNRIYGSYLMLNNPVARADFWRYCILYKQGGIYLDIDSHCITPFNSYINYNALLSINI